LSTVATAASLEVQVTALFEASSGLTAAVTAALPPTAKVMFLGLRLTPVTGTVFPFPAGLSQAAKSRKSPRKAAGAAILSLGVLEPGDPSAVGGGRW
jgi:hypothetical protein